MANLDAFKQRFKDSFGNGPNLAARTIPPDLAQILDRVEGMATPNKLHLLNLAAQCLVGDEVYLEIGTYRGCSVIAASAGNTSRRFLALDDFSQFDGSKQALLDNIERFRRNNVEFVEGDFADSLANRISTKIGVLFIDGPHGFADQIAQFKLAERHLADEAIVIIDDTASPSVRLSTEALTRSCRHLTEFVHIGSAFPGEPQWWNGIDVLFYCRRTANPRTSRGRVYAPILSVLLSALTQGYGHTKIRGSKSYRAYETGVRKLAAAILA